MTIVQIACAGITSLLVRFVDRERNKEKAIFIANIFFLFLLQPSSSLRSANILLPWVMLVLIFAVGMGVCEKITPKEIFQISLLSLLGFLPFLLPQLIPGLRTTVLDKNVNQTILGAFLLVCVCAIGLLAIFRHKVHYLTVLLILILILFVVLKQPQIGTLASRGWRMAFRQNADLASSVDVRWIGYSYVAFRMIHVIREYQKQRLQEINLLRFINFCLFFPTLTAGPIAKYDDFSNQIEEPVNNFQEGMLEGGKRLFFGLFKKFVLADSLALIALNPDNARQITSSGWMWAVLFFYSFQIYFDFSAYTDIAVGLGLFLGIKLPENFNRPYLKSNLTKFWDSWHITLSQWIRTYFFNPLNRTLRKSALTQSPNLILFITQVATMVIIGLWHGITWSFFFWGVWHGLGLFFQNRWSSFIKNRFNGIRENKVLNPLVGGLSTMATFTYVSLGWVWFLSPSLPDAWEIFMKLFGKGF